MKQNLYCIKDGVAKTVMPPFACPNDEVAIREFIIGATLANTPVHDLQLIRVGVFNYSCGVGDDDKVYTNLKNDYDVLFVSDEKIARYSSEVENER